MPTRQRITFANRTGEQLAAALELPDRSPRAYALFAHCFTCGKDIATATRISRTLAVNGIAVLRFDFTGLGSSEGDFANTNFSSNISDLLAAAEYLRREYAAPKLLIGHSLGGTAVLAAAQDIPESKAVVTIGAPASPEHVIKQFADDVSEIETKGESVVALAGREFRIERQFVEDLRAHPLTERIAGLKKALLVFHAPFDVTVAVAQATQIFTAAKHPKSFISLDGADHLVSKLEDAQYVADTITSWVKRYLPDVPLADKPDVPGGEVFIGEGNKRFLREVTSDNHAWVADEPKRVGGDNLGPDPYEHLLAALGTCTSMTIRMYANHKKWPLDDIQVQLEHTREHARDCADCDDKPAQIDVLSQAIRLEGSLDAAQRKRLMEIADRCPVHRTLEGTLRIDTVEWE
ncbi:MAG: bifunctional alpha/beta hydrolase/OsmC family protein [Gammaproteobacteria bacterium]|nr:bifunctional alpha/beta hydrolase/OsmC family protein [Gammaproteobacteria bacterium]MCZ6855568.1 bifunctional alpha/beta hydrolase/OsmC family protein [Gammaproteobacteria bacterium]